MAKYQLLKDGSKLVGILQKEDAPTNSTISIPIDTRNKDYRAYVEWAKTNTADPA
jgi:hypothetical protein|tara:strand:- start:43 stop:207 length:165 start_codon:yes stop_codon:yes gene_type:complete